MAGIVYSPVVSHSHPTWAKDYGDREHLVAGGARVDPAQFPRSNSVLVTVGANAAQNAVSVTVSALSGPIPNGSLIEFASGMYLHTTAVALAGATTLTVSPLPAALTAGQVSEYRGTGNVTIPDGTLIGRTFAERLAGVGFGPAADADDEMFLLYHTISDAYANADATLYRHGSLVAINNVPGYDALSAAKKTYIAAKYQTTIGAD